MRASLLIFTILIGFALVVACDRLTKFDNFAELEIVNKTERKISRAIMTQGNLRRIVSDISSGTSKTIRWDAAGEADLEFKLVVEFDGARSVESGENQARNADKLRAFVFDENIQTALIKTSW